MKTGNLKVLGTHCYLGGFLIGLQRAGLNITKSLEVWKPGLRGAQKLGLPSENFSFNQTLPKKLKANIVVGNPPCSRFSHLSLSFFKKESHEEIKTFPEILNLAQVAKEVKAEIVWWETGPLAWSLGKPLLFNFHQHLEKIWGRVTTLIILIDLRSIGIPQKRPRTHIIHWATKTKPTGSPRISWPPKVTIGDWLQLKTKNFPLNTPVSQNGITNPLRWAKKQDREMTFRSMVPKIVSLRDWHANAVVSRRLMVWQEENRWFDLLEYATLMTYPLKRIEKLIAEGKTPVSTQVLLSKSVAPAITQWIAEKILLPWINQENNPAEIMSTPWQKDIWKLDLGIPSRREKKFASGQTCLL